MNGGVARRGEATPRERARFHVERCGPPTRSTWNVGGTTPEVPSSVADPQASAHRRATSRDTAMGLWPQLDGSPTARATTRARSPAWHRSETAPSPSARARFRCLRPLPGRRHAPRPCGELLDPDREAYSLNKQDRLVRARRETCDFESLSCTQVLSFLSFTRGGFRDAATCPGHVARARLARRCAPDHSRSMITRRAGSRPWLRLVSPSTSATS